MRLSTIWLLMLLLLGSAYFNANANLTQSTQYPFIYFPKIPSLYKQMEIDDNGITVVTSNRYFNGDKQIVLYHLDHSRLLQWVIEDKISTSILDSVISNNAIYVLYVTNKQAQIIHEVAKFSRLDGSLIWRKTIDNVTGEEQILKVNELLNILIVAGVHEDITHISRYDSNGNFINSWSKDLALFTGLFGTGFEAIYAIYLLDDGSIITLSVLGSPSFELRVLRIGVTNEEIFDYSYVSKTIIGSIPPRLLITADNQIFIAYEEEDLSGVPRLSQFSLSITGKLLFSKKYSDLTHIRAGHIVHNSANVLTVSIKAEPNIDLEFFLTHAVTGENSSIFNYAYTGKGQFRQVSQITQNTQNNIFVVASMTNPFPDFFSDTLYLQWRANGQLCNEVQVDESDSDSVVRFYNNHFYELRYLLEDISNTTELHVLEHSINPSCLMDDIFYSGFENTLIPI